MSWESTQTYYRLVNEGIRDRLGGLHSAELILYSVDFEPIERLQRDARWDDAGAALANAARGLEAAGAEGLVLCTNTMHKVAPAIEAAIGIPLLHIADATGAAVAAAGHATVGLLGTRFTMTEDFYRGRLAGRFGLEVLVPEETDRDVVDRVIFDELCLGRVLEPSRERYRRIMGAGDHPRLHRDLAPGRHRGRSRAPVRHDRAARGGGGRVGAGGLTRVGSTHCEEVNG